MDKCFEIDQDGKVHQGIRIENYTKAIEGITRPSIVIGGKGMGSKIGLLPIYSYDKQYYRSHEERLEKNTDENSRVYGLWYDFENNKYRLTFQGNGKVSLPHQFGSSKCMIAFRTGNRCQGLDAYTGNVETITCDKCKRVYVGKPVTIARRCQDCNELAKSSFDKFPGRIMVSGESYNEGDSQVGTEIVARFPMGYAFRVALHKELDIPPIECYYQFNGSDIDVLGRYSENCFGSMRKR